jgi:hypothetical protein
MSNRRKKGRKTAPTSRRCSVRRGGLAGRRFFGAAAVATSTLVGQLDLVGPAAAHAAIVPALPPLVHDQGDDREKYRGGDADR